MESHHEIEFFKVSFPESHLIANGVGMTLARQIGDAFRAGDEKAFDEALTLVSRSTTPAIELIANWLKHHSSWGKG